MKINKSDKQLIELLQELVQIPSYIPDDREKSRQQNENKLVDYLEKWLEMNTKFDLERQELDYGRFNLIAKKGRPDLIFMAHTDTVTPSSNAPYNQLAAEIHNNKIWGRGAADMKSGIATMIQALSLVKDIDNIWLFLYADEEYDFLGMKGLVKEYSNIKPKLLVSSDGSDLGFGHGCRGLIEFRGRFYGKTGHPAKGNGINAIEQGFEVLQNLKKFVFSHKHKVMGGSSFNTAHVIGGANISDSLDKSGNLNSVGQAGNVIADIFEFVLDIRPATPELTPDKIFEFLQDESKKRKLKFEIVKKTHNYGAWYTDLEDISDYLEIAQETLEQKVEIDNPGNSGYIDMQMFWDKIGRPPAFMFGGGKGSTAHTPDEHIEIESLIKERDFFVNLLKNWSKNK